MADIDFDKLSELVISYQNGDGKAFEQIYNMTYRTAKFTALKILNNNESDADDVMQDCYIKAMEKMDTLKNPSSFMSWFNMIIANRARSVIRKNNPHFFQKDEEEDQSYLDYEWAKEFGDFNQSDYDDYSDNNDDGGYSLGESKKRSFVDTDSSEDYESFLPESELEQEELCKTVMDMIENLSEEKKTAVILFYYNNMTTREISESIGVSENTIKSRLVQAKKDLSKVITAYENKNGKLLGVAPASLIVWALQSSSVSVSITPFVATGIAAGTAAGTAAAGSVAAGTGIATKIIAGVVIAGVVAGGSVAGSRIIKKKNTPEVPSTVVSDVYVASDIDETDEPEKTETTTATTQPVTVAEGKLVETVTKKRDIGHGIVLIDTTYYNKDGSVYHARPIADRGKYAADYDDVLPEVNENQTRFDSYIKESISQINKKRSDNNLPLLQNDSLLSEQAGVRAQEIAYTAKNNTIRPDGSPYTSVFDRNGFTDGSREELRAYNYSTYENAIGKLLENQAVTNGSYEKIGVGIAKDIESEKWVIVVHLYASVSGQAKEDPDFWSVFIDRWNSMLEDQNSKDFEKIDRIEEMLDSLDDQSIIGSFMNHDSPILDVFSKAMDRLLDVITEFVERIEE